MKDLSKFIYQVYLIISKKEIVSCNKDYSSKIDEELKKRFKNTFRFSNNISVFYF